MGFYGAEVWPEGSDLPPMWWSDSRPLFPANVLDRLTKDVSHGIFGYPERQDDYYHAAINWFKEQHDTDIKKEMAIHGVLPGIAIAPQMLTDKVDQIVIQVPGIRLISQDHRTQRPQSTKQSTDRI